MKLIRKRHRGMIWIYRGILLAILVTLLAACVSRAQQFSTTTVQGTVYTAGGGAGSGTLQLSWPAFTTAAGQAIAAGRTTVTIGSDGFMSVNLAPNVGATPGGLYYTAVYHLSDGATSTEYWVVPAAAQATIASVRAQVMPAAQAVQAVSKGYVDQEILELTQSLLTAGGGNLSGPLYLSGDPSAPTQAADKHYVDLLFGGALPTIGGVLQGPVTATEIGGVFQADQAPGADFGGRLQACINGLNATYGGVCDARNFSGSLSMGANVTIGVANTTVYLPCATIATSNSIVIPAGTRNVTLHGCASRGASKASGSQGGTVFLYSGAAVMVEVGDSTYASDTVGFHLDNVAINTTAATAATAQGLVAWRTQELNLSGLYLMGNANQTGITLDGTGDYTGGTIEDVQLTGFLTAINAIGHQAANPATTDWVNASTFLRLHIDCPTTNGNPTSGTTGINLLAGDGNTFTGGDVEGCATALHLGANAQNNTLVGLRNENSTSQVTADAGSAYNNWTTGGTMFNGALSDAGTRNSFLDTFHRSFNGLNGDWYGSQQDATVTNHFRLGVGSGNERGLLNRYQTDYGYRWTMGLSDAAGGQQYYQVLDELNNVYRISVGQYNQGQSSTNNQTVINAAGSGAVILNGSNNSGTGGVLIGSGGTASTAVATISNAGNALFNGTLQVGGASTFVNSTTVRNGLNAEIDAFLQAGATASQKESFTYRDYSGASQWYMVKDANNNWSLNSAVGSLDSFKAYQSSNSGDTYVNSANATGVVRINYEAGTSGATKIYSGGSTPEVIAGFTATNAIQFPGLAASSGHNCLQIDNAGWMSNAGQSCGMVTGVASAGLTFSDSSVQTTSQQGALTGAANDATARTQAAAAVTTANSALTNVNSALTAANAALPANGATSSGTGSANLVAFPGALTAGTAINAQTPVVDCRAATYAGGAQCDGTSDDTAAIQACWTAAGQSSSTSSIAKLPKGTCNISKTLVAPPAVMVSGYVQLHNTTLQGEEVLGSALGAPVGGTIFKWIGGSGGSNDCPTQECSSGTYAQPVGVDLFDVSGTHVRGVTVDMTGSSPATSGSIGIWYHSDNNPSSHNNSVDHATIAGAHQEFVCGAPDSLGTSDLPHTAQADSLDFDRNQLNEITDSNNPMDGAAVGIHVNSQNCLQQSRITGNGFGWLSRGVEVYQNNGGWLFAHNNNGPMAGEKKFIYYDSLFAGDPPELDDNETEVAPLWAVYDLSCSMPNYTEHWSNNQFGSSIYVGGCNTVRSNDVAGSNPYFYPRVVGGNALVVSNLESSGFSGVPGWQTTSQIYPFNTEPYKVGSLIKDSNGYVEQSQSNAISTCSSGSKSSPGTGSAQCWCATHPAWAATAGTSLTESDCGVTWLNLGILTGGHLGYWERDGAGGASAVMTATLSTDTIWAATAFKFPDGTTQTTTAQGALSGSANDSTARSMASAATVQANDYRVWSLWLWNGPNTTFTGYSRMSLQRNIKVTAIDVQLQSSSLTGCTVFPEIGVTDGTNYCYATTAASTTLFNNTSPSGICTFSSGSVLALKTVAGTGSCSGSASGGNITIGYLPN